MGGMIDSFQVQNDFLDEVEYYALLFAIIGE